MWSTTARPTTPPLIAREYPVRVNQHTDRGLATPRTRAARGGGEIVAYIDDDAWPDPTGFLRGVDVLDERPRRGRGPKLPPRATGLIADAVACRRAGPIHVLLTDARPSTCPAAHGLKKTR